MTSRDRFLPIVVAILAGMLVLKWEWMAELAGIPESIQRDGAMLTTEYWIGLAAVFVLGLAFPTRWFATAAWFMWGPTIITHSVFIIQHGIPNLWPLELAFIAALTVPYIAVGYGGAFLRRRWSSNQPLAS